MKPLRIGSILVKINLELRMPRYDDSGHLFAARPGVSADGFLKCVRGEAQDLILIL